ncbi:MAG: DUF4115 domain-containing protein [Desulfomonile sp.]|nr:DUF4115 domain-containing protein [Desulfomonile sp.]
MESFGAYLKSLREESGISLDEIAQRTKIAYSNLDFLEQDRFDLLPPRVFVKGFVRSYVKELGIEPDEVVRRFDDFIKDGEVPDYEVEEHPVFQQYPPVRSFIGSTIFTTVLTAAGVVALAILLLTGVTRLFVWNNKAGAPRPTVTTMAPAEPAAVASGTAREEPAARTAFAEPPRTQAGRKILEIKARANAWIRVQPDNGPAEELLMKPNDVQIFTAKEGFQIQTGNAGGIRLRFDGRELDRLGKDNQSLSISLP